MFKTIPWILLLLPFTKSYAEQGTPQQTDNNTDTVIDQSTLTNGEILSEEQIISPRNRDEFFRQCYIKVPAQVPSTETRPNELIPVKIDALSVNGSND
jgi:LPS-assembly protein